MPISHEKHRKILEEVLSLPTAPFYEDKVMEYVEKFAQEHKIPVQKGRYGLILEYKNGPDREALGLMAHMDHPGFEIQGMEGKYLKLVRLGGGAIPQVGEKLVLFADGKETLVKVKELGYAEEMPAPSETPRFFLVQGPIPKKMQGFAMYNLKPCIWRKEKVYSRAIDDLSGCAGLLALLDLLVERKPQAHVYCIFTRAEEVGFVGACDLALSGILPKGLPIITLEASKMLPSARQGYGVVVRLGDRRGVFDAALTNFLLTVAENLTQQVEGFRYQKALLDGGTCESSALLALGHPSSGVAVPLGHYHNHGKNNRVAAEHIHSQDWYGMVELLFHAVAQYATRKPENREAYFLKKFVVYQDRLGLHEGPKP